MCKPGKLHGLYLDHRALLSEAKYSHVGPGSAVRIIMYGTERYLCSLQNTLIDPTAGRVVPQDKSTDVVVMAQRHGDGRCGKQHSELEYERGIQARWSDKPLVLEWQPGHARRVHTSMYSLDVLL